MLPSTTQHSFCKSRRSLRCVTKNKVDLKEVTRYSKIQLDKKVASAMPIKYISASLVYDQNTFVFFLSHFLWKTAMVLEKGFTGYFQDQISQSGETLGKSRCFLKPKSRTVKRKYIRIETPTKNSKTHQQTNIFQVGFNRLKRLTKTQVKRSSHLGDIYIKVACVVNIKLFFMNSFYYNLIIIIK